MSTAVQEASKCVTINIKACIYFRPYLRGGGRGGVERVSCATFSCFFTCVLARSSAISWKLLMAFLYRSICDHECYNYCEKQKRKKQGGEKKRKKCAQQPNEEEITKENHFVHPNTLLCSTPRHGSVWSGIMPCQSAETSRTTIRTKKTSNRYYWAIVEKARVTPARLGDRQH